MIDHIGLSVADYERSKAFYQAALAPLGYGLGDGSHRGRAVGRVRRRRQARLLARPGRATTPQIHVAFAARDRATVRAFYDAALAAGAQDNGPPGLRPEYHPNCYGPFVLDPDGHNIEAVCHEPE